VLCSAAQAPGGQQHAVSASVHNRLPRWRCAPRPWEWAFERKTNDAVFRGADYVNPEAFSETLMKCMRNDWQLDAKWSSSVVLWLAKVTGRAGAMVTVDLHFLKAELKKDPQTALRTIMGAYLKLVKDAKQKHKRRETHGL
jgi:hypothetical protein